jgi:hypothetical protein
MGRGNRHSDGLRGEYLLLSIIPTGPKPARFPMPLMALGAVLALGVGLIVAFMRPISEKLRFGPYRSAVQPNVNSPLR